MGRYVILPDTFVNITIYFYQYSVSNWTSQKALLTKFWPVMQFIFSANIQSPRDCFL